MTKFLIFLSLLLVYSCYEDIGHKSHENVKINSNETQIEKVDSLKILLKKSLYIDTFEFENRDPFFYIKTGNIISKQKKMP